MNDSSQGEPGALDDTTVRLCAENLVVRYGEKTVLDIPELVMTTGVTVVTGPNGAGKTTLLKVGARVLPATSGRVGLTEPGTGDFVSDAKYRGSVGYLPQNPDFPGHFTVVEAITYSAWLRGIPSSVRSESVTRVMDELALEASRSTRLRSLSGGNRQRVHIAQAIVHRPAVLLLDEPTTGIDVEHRVELRKVLAGVGASCCVVMSTHHTEDIELLADRVVSLRGGRIVFRGTPRELMARADEPSAGVPHPSPEARSIERALRDLGGAG